MRRCPYRGSHMDDTIVRRKIYSVWLIIGNDLFILLGKRRDCGAGLGPQLLVSNESMETNKSLWAFECESARSEPISYIFIRMLLNGLLNEVFRIQNYRRKRNWKSSTSSTNSHGMRESQSHSSVCFRISFICFDSRSQRSTRDGAGGPYVNREETFYGPCFWMMVLARSWLYTQFAPGYIKSGVRPDLSFRIAARKPNRNVWMIYQFISSDRCHRLKAFDMSTGCSGATTKTENSGAVIGRCARPQTLRIRIATALNRTFYWK